MNQLNENELSVIISALKEFMLQYSGVMRETNSDVKAFKSGYSKLKKQYEVEQTMLRG